MRIIKFRAQIEGTNQWAYGNLFKSKNECRIIPEQSFIYDECKLDEFYKVDEDTVGQFTGYKDKNGKDIYEGDIIKGGIYLIFLVKWDAEDNGWNIRNEHNISNHYEIIANIHCNPELLS